MSFKLTKALPYNLHFYSIGAEVSGSTQDVELTYTATGINFGGKQLQEDTEIVFAITADTPKISTNTVITIQAASLDATELLAQAEAALQAQLEAE